MLFGSTALEVAIGMIFVYLLMSLLCSALGELIEAILKFRARDLERGIRRLLADPQLADEFFKNPIIKPFYTDRRRPSYIPARTFSLALWNMATSAVERTPAAIAGVTSDLKMMRSAITQLPASALPDDLRGVLVALIDEAGGNFNRARTNIEEWYNDAMDRVSGRFKRRVHMILFGLGLLLSVGMNVDSVNLINTLSHDTELRKAVAAAAENYASTPLETGGDEVQGGATAAAGDEQADAADAGQRFEESVARINRIRGEIIELGLPIGWSWGPLSEDPRGLPANFGGWVLKIAGFLLTALAVSQGAPFWFDLLNKFIVIRSTVKPREKSEVQPSKDRPAPETEVEMEPDEDSKG